MEQAFIILLALGAGYYLYRSIFKKKGCNCGNCGNSGCDGKKRK